MELIVGMGQYAISGGEEDILRTFALASCVAVTAYHPIKRAAGMIHIVLPTPLSRKDVTERPAYFAQTGVPLLIHVMCRRTGCRKEELLIQLFGGAGSMLEQDVFHVGKKNIEAVKYSLSELGMSIRREELGGKESRTISMDAKTGTVQIYRLPLNSLNGGCNT